jgi:hypothetical protein
MGETFCLWRRRRPTFRAPSTKLPSTLSLAINRVSIGPLLPRIPHPRLLPAVCSLRLYRPNGLSDALAAFQSPAIYGVEAGPAGSQHRTTTLCALTHVQLRVALAACQPACSGAATCGGKTRRTRHWTAKPRGETKRKLFCRTMSPRVLQSRFSRRNLGYSSHSHMALETTSRPFQGPAHGEVASVTFSSSQTRALFTHASSRILIRWQQLHPRTSASHLRFGEKASASSPQLQPEQPCNFRAPISQVMETQTFGSHIPKYG